MSTKTKITDQAGDALYQYFEPLLAIFRYFLIRQYRVTYWYDGMSLMQGTKTFTAWHDRQARRIARKIAGNDTFELEMYRPIRLK